MKVRLNFEQRKSLSGFFSSLSIAWFIAIFATPSIVKDFNLLTTLMYIVNMIGALYISLWLLKENNYDK